MANACAPKPWLNKSATSRGPTYPISNQRKGTQSSNLHLSFENLGYAEPRAVYPLSASRDRKHRIVTIEMFSYSVAHVRHALHTDLASLMQHVTCAVKTVCDNMWNRLRLHFRPQRLVEQSCVRFKQNSAKVSKLNVPLPIRQQLNFLPRYRHVPTPCMATLVRLSCCFMQNLYQIVLWLRDWLRESFYKPLGPNMREAKKQEI